MVDQAPGIDSNRGRMAGVLHSLRGLPSRRDVLRGLAATGLGLGLAALPALTEAQLKRRKKRKPLPPAKPNRFGCLEINDPCRRHRQCCSGICRGLRGRRRCRAHGNGTCSQTTPAICEAGSPRVTFCNNSPTCVCMRTTAGSAFCGETTGLLDRCTSCKRDADCVKLGFPPKSACAPVATGTCVGTCPTGMVCMVPCGSVPPAPTANAIARLFRGSDGARA